MGRGAKIFLISAILSGLVFGLVAFAVISGIIDKNKVEEKEPAQTSAFVNTFYTDNNLEEI